MFVEATPNGQLAKIYRKALKEVGMKICVVEIAGISLKKILKKSDPSVRVSAIKLNARCAN